MPETPDVCDRIARWPPVARVDAMYLALPTWQRLLLMFVTVAGVLHLPARAADVVELARLLSPLLALGLFVGQVLLFTWLNDR